MKRLFILVAIIFSFTAFLTSCEKEENTNNTAYTTNILQQGQWIVTLLKENGTDQTESMKDFEFSFSPNGNVTVTKPGISSSQTGLWNVYDNNNQPILYLNFNNVFIFNLLNNDWRIIEQNNNLIRMESTNNGWTDLLTLVRI
ncbi:MAG: hypothetical protein FGM46_05345 [Ferruginibacter sp.]|nr:hypothetical protein [Ferruginibacter sp.]